MLDVNFGSASIQSGHDEDVKLGGFIGVGVAVAGVGAKWSNDGLSYSELVEGQDIPTHIWASGLRFHAGIQAKFGKVPMGLTVGYIPAGGDNASLLSVALVVPL
jgi:hypothetical protein